MQHHQHGHHDHGHHGHGHHGHTGHDGHGTIRLDPRAPGRRDVYRIGRRRFLTEFGRNTVAVAILGGFVAACSGDDDAASTPTDAAPEPSTTATPTTQAQPAPATTAPADTEPAAPPTTQGLPELQWEQTSFGFVSAYVLVRGTKAAVVDTGVAGSADAIGESLQLLGVTYDDVLSVVLTHKHPDHVGSLDDVMARAERATVYAGEGDIAAIQSASPLVAVGDGDEVLGLQVVETPGHTPGSISLFDPGIGLLVAGDALNGNGAGDGLSGANPEFTEDMAVAGESIAALAALDVQAVAMGHGQPVRQGAGPLLAALV